MEILVLPNVQDADLKASFSRNSDEGLLNFRDIPAVLKTAYRGETPHLRSEAAAIASKITSDMITVEEFMIAVDEVRCKHSINCLHHD